MNAMPASVGQTNAPSLRSRATHVLDKAMTVQGALGAIDQVLGIGAVPTDIAEPKLSPEPPQQTSIDQILAQADHQLNMANERLTRIIEELG